MGPLWLVFHMPTLLAGCYGQQCVSRLCRFGETLDIAPRCFMNVLVLSQGKQSRKGLVHVYST